MSDESPQAEDVVEPEIAPPAPGRSRRWKWPLLILGALIVVPALVFALWSWVALTYTYSQGDRAGYVQKFSKKGWICKTWEGELSMINIPGAAPERWQFSVRNDSLARIILDNMGNRVSLEYAEHRGVPTSCFGETVYFVKGIRRVAQP
jgi:hypothetical protein